MRLIKNARYLFLDRDGVINVRLIDDYVKRKEEFEFLEGSLEAFKIFVKYFDKIVVVTNQQGIGKGLMSENDLEQIHSYMKNEVELAGGRIDEVFFCPNLAKENSIDRKPSVGMGLKARKLFREIRFKDSIMVGDSLSDMVFGKRLKMHTVFIAPSPSKARKHPKRIDKVCNNLLEFAKYIENEKNI
ncbi:MAG: HAD-IIIA family hydrolase [Bacteroidales bacterium]|nr:HAD-IIIA family hydrolase [Bacteroidales bacterium]